MTDIEVKLSPDEATAMLWAARHRVAHLKSMNWPVGRELESVIATLELAVLPKAGDSGRKPLDPKPWAYALLGGNPETWAREAEQVTGGFVFQPREGYEQDHAFYYPGARRG
jgi:hypothetical protein